MTDNYRNDNGQFVKGNPGKPKGSSKNKLRDEIRTFLNERWQDFPTWFDELKPIQKIEVMMDLLPYSVSRLQSVSVNDIDGNELEQKTTTDWTKLSSVALAEVLALTTINHHEEKESE